MTDEERVELEGQVKELEDKVETLEDERDELLAASVQYEYMPSLLESLEAFADWQSGGYASNWKEEASLDVGLALWEVVSDNFARAQGYRLPVPTALQRARP